jgi:uncharacterized protein YllA (UPF0747 family)
MTRKTPEEIEAMAKILFPDPDPRFGMSAFTINESQKRTWIAGLIHNTELADFKKELVEKVKKLIEYAAKHKDFFGETMAEHILDLLTQEDQPEGGKEEKL